MAEGLLYRTRAHSPAARTGLQGQWGASAGGGGSAVVVLVAHALALHTGRAIPATFNSNWRAKPAKALPAAKIPRASSQEGAGESLINA